LEVFIPRIKPGLEAPTDNDVVPFPYLKRDLVRLLGVLSFEDKSIGDRVRAVEGVEVILGLCVTDERNPCTCLAAFSLTIDLREHALFAVKNLLYENEENQDILRKMEPLGVVGDNGELLPLPDNLKKRGTK
jgi:ataxin-10